MDVLAVRGVPEGTQYRVIYSWKRKIVPVSNWPLWSMASRNRRGRPPELIETVFASTNYTFVVHHHPTLDPKLVWRRAADSVAFRSDDERMRAFCECFSLSPVTRLLGY